MKSMTMEEVKCAEYDMLVRFSEYCDQNNLCYTLAGGTLLGAIRHKGFIPWDDDIDVMMPRPDYEKFLKMQSEKEVLVCKSLGNKSLNRPFAKILDLNTVVEFDDHYEKDSSNLWIDVFPIDGLPKSEWKTKIIYFICRLLKRGILVSEVKLGKERKIIKKILKALFWCPAKIIGSRNFSKLIDNYARKIGFFESDYIGGITWGYGPQEKMPRKEWMDRVKVQFNGKEFWAPGCWDLYLKRLYGDYMQLPPIDKRVTHHINAWKLADEKDKVS